MEELRLRALRIAAGKRKAEVDAPVPGASSRTDVHVHHHHHHEHRVVLVPESKEGEAVAVPTTSVTSSAATGTADSAAALTSSCLLDVRFDANVERLLDSGEFGRDAPRTPPLEEFNIEALTEFSPCEEFEVAGYAADALPTAVYTAQELLASLERKRVRRYRDKASSLVRVRHEERDALYPPKLVWSASVLRHIHALRGDSPAERRCVELEYYERLCAQPDALRSHLDAQRSRGGEHEVRAELFELRTDTLATRLSVFVTKSDTRRREAREAFAERYREALWLSQRGGMAVRHGFCWGAPCLGCEQLQAALRERFPRDHWSERWMAPGDVLPFEPGVHSALSAEQRQFEAARMSVLRSLANSEMALNPVTWRASSTASVYGGAHVTMLEHWMEVARRHTRTEVIGRAHCAVQCVRHSALALASRSCRCKLELGEQCAVCVCTCARHARVRTRPKSAFGTTPNARYYEFRCRCTTAASCAQCACTCAEYTTMYLCRNYAHKHSAQQRHDIENIPHMQCSPASPCIVATHFSPRTWAALLHFAQSLPHVQHGADQCRAFRALLSTTRRRSAYNCLLDFARHADERTRYEERTFWFDATNLWHTILAVLLFTETTNAPGWDDVWSMLCRAVLAHASFCPSCFTRTHRGVYAVLVFNAMAPVLSSRMARRLELDLARKITYRRDVVELRHPRPRAGDDDDAVLSGAEYGESDDDEQEHFPWNRR